jgi:putative nucleotidyltransferase with HDIG domain
MRGTQRVVLSYLKSVNAAATVTEDRKSKVGMATQTTAVEKMLKDVVDRMLPEYRGKVYAVGGYVRDKLLGTNPKDIDLVVDSPEDDMKAAEIFSKKFADAIGVTSANNPSLLKDKYGIWGVALLYPKDDGRPFAYDGIDVSGYVLEITPPRIEGPYNKKREPEYVKYAPLEEDAKRRDLTVNAIYRDVSSGEIKDFVGGMEDLKNKTLKPPPHPGGIEQIYKEDPLRIFRIIRFKGKLPGFTIDENTYNALKRFAASEEGKSFIANKVSKERVKEELHKIITHPDGNVAAEGLDMMRDMGVLDFVAPALIKLIGVKHDFRYGHHGESVWDHTLDVIRKTPSSEVARLSALFHDIGKPAAVKEESGKIMFPGHAEHGVDLVGDALRELKFDNKTIKTVSNIVHSHMALTAQRQSEKERIRVIRSFIQAVYDNIDDALAVIEADVSGSPGNFQEIKKRVLELKKDDEEKGLLAQSKGTYRYVYPLTGDEIKEEFKEIVDGPVLGEILNRLKRMVMEGDISGDVRNEARNVLSKWAQQKGWEKQIAQALDSQKAAEEENRKKAKPNAPKTKAFDKII